MAKFKPSIGASTLFEKRVNDHKWYTPYSILNRFRFSLEKIKKNLENIPEKNLLFETASPRAALDDFNTFPFEGDTCHK